MRTHLIASILLGALWLPAGVGATSTEAPASAASTPTAEEVFTAQIRALAQANAAMVGLRSEATDDARSIDTLGRERSGSGVVIDSDGLVLTIGYLILEAEKVEITTDAGTTVPAQVVAYDLATGFGLVKPLVPITVQPVRLGSSALVGNAEPLMIASGGSDGDVSMAQMVSRRAFSGFWEYFIEGALFTSPPRIDHSGAGLFNQRGELVGIGSLLVMDATGSGWRLPGNMFVPIDLLKPILGELTQQGASRSSARAWLGISSIEEDGRIKVIRVSRDSPAQRAGLQSGDIVLAIDGTIVQSLEALYKRLWSDPRAEREITLTVLQGAHLKQITVRTVDRMTVLRRAPGV